MASRGEKALGIAKGVKKTFTNSAKQDPFGTKGGNGGKHRGVPDVQSLKGPKVPYDYAGRDSRTVK